jgi:sirohydrochlorin ferrochelatase
MPAYIELTEPLLDEGIDALGPEAESVTVVPLSLFAAGHVKNDIPLFVQYGRQAYPETDFHYGSNLGARPEMIEMVADRIEAATADIEADPTDDDVAVVFVARGSSDPDANSEAYRLARLVYEGRPYSRVETAFIGITEPHLDQVMAEVTRHDPDAVVVMPYMLGDGVLNQRIADTVAEYDADHEDVEATKTDVLGVDERLIRALEHRVMEARQGAVSMSCDQCIYKVTLEDYAEEVGGEQAFVHSLEHTLAHVSDEHEHSHDHGDDEDGHDHGEDDHGHGHGHDDGHGHGHGHGSGHDHGHDHDHSHGHDHGHDE